MEWWKHTATRVVSFEKDTALCEQHMTTMALLWYQDQTGKIVAIGSGFIVMANELGAVCLTAAHVIREVARRERATRPGSSVGPFTSEPRPDLSPAIQQLRLRAMFTNGRDICVVPVTQVLASHRTDAAMLWCNFRRAGGRPSFIGQCALNSDIPELGAVVTVPGYCNAHWHPEDGPTWQFQLRASRVGRIYPDGYTLVRGPCFEVNLLTEHQVSGGPVIVAPLSGSGPVVVCGIVSSSVELSNDRDGKTIAAMVSGAMGLRLPVEPYSEGRCMTLYHLVAGGHVVDVGDWRALEVVDTEGGFTVRSRSLRSDS